MFSADSNVLYLVRIILAGGAKAIELNVSVLGGRLYLEEFDPVPYKYVVHGLTSYTLSAQATNRYIRQHTISQGEYVG